MATWPAYFVWNAYQAEWVRSATRGNADIHTVGPIEFTDVSAAVCAIPEGAVAVFDISYYRFSVNMGFSTMADFLAAHPDGFHSFLSDCRRITREMDVPMVLKTKRDIAHRSQTRYCKLVESTLTDQHVIAVTPEIAASRVIQQCGHHICPVHVYRAAGSRRPKRVFRSYRLDSEGRPCGARYPDTVGAGRTACLADENTGIIASRHLAATINISI